MSSRLSCRILKRYFSYTKLKRRGILTTLLRVVKPLVKIMEKLGLRFLLILVAIQLIKAYQKYLSPLKGFSCAYSYLYNAESCSEYFRKTIKKYGLAKAIPLFEQRLRDCKLANRTLKAQCLNEQQQPNLDKKNQEFSRIPRNKL